MNEYEPNPKLQNLVNQPKKDNNKILFILIGVIVLLIFIIFIMSLGGKKVIEREVEKKRSLDEISTEIRYFIDVNKLDALDAFGCHGIGGIWGGIATGLFTQTSINDVARWNGLFFGDTQLFIAQIISIVVTIAVAIIGTLICIAIVRCFTTLRVSKQEEQKGLDISEHQENAYPSFNGLD